MIAALLAGLFGVPAVLLWLGHRLQRRASVVQHIFWGALAGHSVGLVVALVAMHLPPVAWEESGRVLAVHGAMVLGGALGAAVAAVLHR